MKIEQKDIFLVPFPFSDFSGSKVRPVLIISNNRFNNSSKNIIVCGITSNLDKKEYSIKIDNKSIIERELYDSCCIKTENILKIDKELLIKKIGKLKQEIFAKVLKAINSIIS